MRPEELATRATESILNGTNLTLSLPTNEKWPHGWPRGELLSVNGDVKNFSFDPLKILKFMQTMAKLDKVNN